LSKSWQLHGVCNLQPQVLSGIIPISRVSAVPACIFAACQYLPLERIYGLSHPSVGSSQDEDRRTWRDGVKHEKRKETIWTAMDVLVAFALKNGWETAKAARPDIHRAGNASKHTITPFVFSNELTYISITCDCRGPNTLGFLARRYRPIQADCTTRPRNLDQQIWFPYRRRNRGKI
jgi:hypothetical protein